MLLSPPGNDCGDDAEAARPALAAGPTALPSTLAFADLAHRGLGSELPFAWPEMSESFTGQLDAFPMDHERRDKINHANATARVTRLAQEVAA